MQAIVVAQADHVTPQHGLRLTTHSKAGSVSTALIEAYRDKNGRPRQRVLANLHGEPTTLRALAKLAVTHDLLLEERSGEHAEPWGRALCWSRNAP
jgi:hypothetical protein